MTILQYQFDLSINGFRNNNWFQEIRLGVKYDHDCIVYTVDKHRSLMELHRQKLINAPSESTTKVVKMIHQFHFWVEINLLSNSKQHEKRLYVKTFWVSISSKKVRTSCQLPHCTKLPNPETFPTFWSFLGHQWYPSLYTDQLGSVEIPCGRLAQLQLIIPQTLLILPLTWYHGYRWFGLLSRLYIWFLALGYCNESVFYRRWKWAKMIFN